MIPQNLVCEQWTYNFKLLVNGQDVEFGALLLLVQVIVPEEAVYVCTWLASTS
jgi:hypothetical protein